MLHLASPGFSDKQMLPGASRPRIWQPKFVSDDGTAHKIGELRVEQENNLNQLHTITRGVCWHVVFAPDESCFAWMCSSKKLILVPWDRQKNCLVAEGLGVTTLKTADETSNRLLDGHTSPPPTGFTDAGKRQRVIIECGYPVLSVAFGSRTPEKNLVSESKNRAYWTRLNYTRDIFLATGHTNGRIRVWSIENGKLLLELMDHKSGVRDLSFAPDGSLRLISASLDKTLKGWDLKDDGNMFQTFYAHKDTVIWCSWSPNAKIMASGGSEKFVYIWDMEAYKLKLKLVGHCQNVVSCSFSPDGALLATASWDTQVILWDPYTGKQLHTLFHVHPPPNLIYASGINDTWVRGVSFAKDGMSVVTIADDQLVRFWNIMGDVDPEGIAGTDQGPLCCAYSPSGRCVAVGAGSFNVSFYATPLEVPRLIHLSRMAVRKIVPTPYVDRLEIPIPLKLFLKYEVWS